jgi:hypothetical protein
LVQHFYTAGGEAVQRFGLYGGINMLYFPCAGQMYLVIANRLVIGRLFQFYQ